jgi:hypothetical protein
MREKSQGNPLGKKTSPFYSPRAFKTVAMTLGGTTNLGSSTTA